MAMTYLHTKFHIPSPSGSLVITTKPKRKHGFKQPSTDVVYFSEIWYYTSN